jgi:ketosteroid isomerase-like protein
MSTPVSSKPESHIRSLVDGWTEALRARDVTGRTAHYADDVLIFDVINPIQHVGLGALRQRLAQWLSTFDGPIDSEVRDLQIAADGQAAFCHSLQRFRGALKNGGTLDMLVRYTTCLRKIGDRWVVTHEHASAPFDPATGLALVITPASALAPGGAGSVQSRAAT